MRIRASAQVLGTGSDGTAPTLILSIERRAQYGSEVKLLQRYLFNAGEGTNRMCCEHKVKLNTLSSILLTTLEPAACAGIAGCIFSLSDVGRADLRICGPEVGQFQMQTCKTNLAFLS
jgi:ribonuclease Z